MASKKITQKNPVGRPDEAKRTVATLKRTPGQWQTVGTFKMFAAMQRIARLKSLGITELRVEGTPEAMTIMARVKVGQKVGQAETQEPVATSA